MMIIIFFSMVLKNFVLWWFQGCLWFVGWVVMWMVISVVSVVVILMMFFRVFDISVIDLVSCYVSVFRFRMISLMMMLLMVICLVWDRCMGFFLWIFVGFLVWCECWVNVLCLCVLWVIFWLLVGDVMELYELLVWDWCFSCSVLIGECFIGMVCFVFVLDGMLYYYEEGCIIF